jgi:hypothetical protein
MKALRQGEERRNSSVKLQNDMPEQKDACQAEIYATGAKSRHIATDRRENTFFHGHENDPPKRVIGLALASILFQKCLPCFPGWFFQLGSNTYGEAAWRPISPG